jgi:hypothetical protein
VLAIGYAFLWLAGMAFFAGAVLGYGVADALAGQWLTTASFVGFVFVLVPWHRRGR